MTVSAPLSQRVIPLSEGKACGMQETKEEVSLGASPGFTSEGPRQDGTRNDTSVVVSGTRTCSTWKRDGRFLYFIENPALGLIKIGITGFDVDQRRLNLERACGVPLRVMLVMEGAAGWEQDLLAAFDDSRALGEWFRPTPDLLDLIARPDSLEEVVAYAWPHISALRGQPVDARLPQMSRRGARSL